MAITFDESTDYYSIADDASLSFPDSDWCFAIWTNTSDNTGSGFQYLISSNEAGGGNNRIRLFLRETSNATNPDKWQLQVRDSDGTEVSQASSSSPGGDGAWRLIVCQRRTADNEVQMYFCEPGQTPSKEFGTSDASFDALNPIAWNIGRRDDGDSARYYGGDVCEFFKGDFSLSSDEIEAIGRGVRVYRLGKTPDVYLEMKIAGVTQRDLFGSNDATENGTPVTADEHAPIVTPPVGLMVTQDAPNPPGTISDLTATAVGIYGAVKLSWTATGDVGDVGTADHVVIKYDTTAIIDEADWTAATEFEDAQYVTPDAFGTSQEYVVTGLTASTTYYFNVRAVSSGAETGALSNSPSATASSTTRSNAFPDGRGPGSDTGGARSGTFNKSNITVYVVDTLNNSGSGSFREACEASGPRIVTFNVSGTIQLSSTLSITNPYITILGPMATRNSGQGITIRDGICRVRTHDVIIRGIRYRPGDTNAPASPGSDDWDAMDVSRTATSNTDTWVYKVIFAECSFSWAIDGNLDLYFDVADLAFYSPGRITIQRCIISECLNNSKHSEGLHSTGSLAERVTNVLYWRCAFVNNRNRAPYVDDSDLMSVINCGLQQRNGAIYLSGDDVASGRINIIGNRETGAPGAGSDNYAVISPTITGNCLVYIYDNIAGRRTSAAQDQDEAIYDEFGDDADGCDPSFLTGSQFTILGTPPEIISNTLVIDDLVSYSGAYFYQDSVDAAVLSDLENDTGAYIDSQADVGGWPALSNFTPGTDSNSDGLEDAVEVAYGYAAGSLDAEGTDIHDDGVYCNIEIANYDITGEEFNDAAPTPPAVSEDDGEPGVGERSFSAPSETAAPTRLGSLGAGQRSFTAP